jgi:hypothetical protein
MHALHCWLHAQTQELRTGDEFWGAEQTAKQLKSASYFTTATSKSASKAASSSTSSSSSDDVPELLQAVLQGGSDSALCLSAFGAALWHLKRCLIDHDLVSMRRCVQCTPVYILCIHLLILYM